MKKILLAGGGSFIGINLCQYLIEKQMDVVVYDIKRDNKYLIENLGAKFIEGNVVDSKRLTKASIGCDVLVNMASIVLPLCYEHPQQEVDACISGSINLIKYANEYGKKFIYFSTSEVYGTAKTPTREIDTCHPTTTYGMIKLSGEQISQTLSSDYLIIRPFNAYGSWLREDEYANFITKAILAGLNDKPLTIYGNLEHYRDWQYIDDLCAAFYAVLLNYHNLKPIVNICSGIEYSLRDVITIVEELCGHELKLYYLPERKGDLDTLLGSTSKLSSATGHKNKVDLKTGIEKYYNWRKNK
jgi:nucleoside-diphosphate-sugar epimerase